MLKQYNIRKEGIILKFVENRVLLFSNAHKFIGTRIYSPIMKEIKTSFRINKKDQQKYYKIFSYSDSSSIIFKIDLCILRILSSYLKIG